MTARWLGIDVGGTNTKLVIAEIADTPDIAGTVGVIAEAALASCPQLGPLRALTAIGRRAAVLRAEHGPVRGVGVTVPGLFDPLTGRTELLPNFPAAWQAADVRTPLERALGGPVALLNDARAFTLAETRKGAARGDATVLCVTLGTGVGGGVVIDGVLRMGPQGRAGEIGHQVVVIDGDPCGCGNRGCVEAYCSALALRRASGRPSTQEAFEAAAGGDERAERAVRRFVGALAAGLGNALTVLRPECVVIGGGVAAAGEPLLAPLRRALAAAAPLVPPSSYRVVPAALGASAGAVGAALCAYEQDRAPHSMSSVPHKPAAAPSSAGTSSMSRTM